MSVTPASAAGAMSDTPASAVGADSEYDDEEEGPMHKVVLPVVDEDVVDEPVDTGGASSSEPLPAPGSVALTSFHFVPFADELLLNKASQAMLRYFPENLEVNKLRGAVMDFIQEIGLVPCRLEGGARVADQDPERRRSAGGLQGHDDVHGAQAPG